MEEQEVAKEEWGLFLLLLLLFWFFFHFFLVSLWLHRIGDLRCKITHEGAEVCLEGLLFPGAPGILLDDHHGHRSCSGWSEISALTPSGQVVSLWFSRPHSLPVVWISAVPGDVDTCWPDPWGQVTLRRWVLLTWGELEWLTQRQKAWYPVTNPLIQPNPHLFPPYPLFFFFFLSLFLRSIYCTSCWNISIASCQRVHLRPIFYTRRLSLTLSSIKQLKSCAPNSKQALL